MTAHRTIEWKKRQLSTREALLASAADLFALKGYEGATVEAVATRAGVNRALVSYHFGGKHRLYLAVLEGLLSPLSDKLTELSRAELSPSDSLDRFTEIVARETARRPALPSLLLREVVSAEGHLDANLTRRVRGVIRILDSIVARGKADGTFRANIPGHAALSLMGSLLFLQASRPFFRHLGLTVAPEVGPAVREEFARLLR
jgi:AcrR family transcriptional regulator